MDAKTQQGMTILVSKVASFDAVMILCSFEIKRTV